MSEIVRVKFDKVGAAARVIAASEIGKTIVANELLKDANYNCREDTGELIRSSIRASDIKGGLLVWDTSYAKRMYYTGKPVLDVNPNASLQWAHKAAKQNRVKYRLMYQKVIEKEV